MRPQLLLFGGENITEVHFCRHNFVSAATILFWCGCCISLSCYSTSAATHTNLLCSFTDSFRDLFDLTLKKQLNMDIYKFYGQDFLGIFLMRQLPYRRWKEIERGEEPLVMYCKPLRYHYLQICKNNPWWGCQNTKFNPSALLLFNYCCLIMLKRLSLNSLPPFKDDISQFFHSLPTYTLIRDGIFPRGPGQGRKCRVIFVVYTVQLQDFVDLFSILGRGSTGL